jgi:hypothetical protein
MAAKSQAAMAAHARSRAALLFAGSVLSFFLQAHHRCTGGLGSVRNCRKLLGMRSSALPLIQIAQYLPDRLHVNVPGFVGAILGEVKRYGGQQ